MRGTVSAVGVIVAAFLLFSSSALCAEQGLVAHFPLNEGSGTVVRDGSANAHEGKIHGARWARTEWGPMLYFDGINDVVNCGAASSLDIRGPMTLSAWVRPEEMPQREVGICGKSFTSYLLTHYRGPTCYWYIGSGGNNAGSGLMSGRWTQITGTFDGTNVRLYLNGELVRDRLSKFKTVPRGGNFLIGGLIGDPDAADMNYTQSGFFKGFIANVRVYSRALSQKEIISQLRAGSERRFALRPSECSPITRGVTTGGGDLLVRVGDGGGIHIKTPNGFCIAESTFSYPARQIGTNAFAENAAAGEQTWQPRLSAGGKTGIRVIARGKRYDVIRTVRVRNNRVEIEDEVRNHSDEPVAIIVRRQVVTPKNMQNARLGWGAEDPIVFASQPDYDLGIVAEDPVSRVQFVPFCGANRAGFRVTHFGLDRGKTYTFRWAVYVLKATGDPMAFINRLRQDWRSNYTVLGPASFFPVVGNPLLKNPVKLKEYLQRRRLGIALFGSPWLDYDPGSMDHVPPRQEYKVMMQRAIKTLKAADPNIKCVGCIEGPLVTVYPEKIKGGERLPQAGPGRRGYRWIAPELTRIIEESDIPWKDSLWRDKLGRVRLELYMRGHKPQTALSVYPARGNYQSKFLLDQVRFLVEEVGLDGFYIDGFSCVAGRSYDRWDGHTVDIDPATGKITLKYTNLGLAGMDPRKALCEYIVSRGLVMVTNGYATTPQENSYPIMYFSEQWGNFDVASLPASGKPPFIPALARSRLGSPIGLGVDGRRLKLPSAELLMRGVILYLRHGMVYYHYYYPDIPEKGEGSGEYGPINHMFPITPVRLFEGGIVGKERTITCVSGTYEWNRPNKPTVRVFGPDGRAKQGDFTLKQTDRRWTVKLRLNDWNNIAVIAD